MAGLEDYITQLQGTEFLGNSLWQYLGAGITFVVSFVILFGLKIVLNRYLNRIQRIRENAIAKILINTTKKYLNITLILVLSLYLASLNLTFNDLIGSIVKIIILAIIGWIVLKFILSLMDSIVEYQREIRPQEIHILEFFRMILRLFVIALITLWFLSENQVNVTSFLAGIGVLSLGIAFALREVIADIFASIIIFIDQPFEVGDGIIAGDVRGSIEKIGIRSTTIRAPEGHIVIVSNRKLTSKRIHNMKQMLNRRIVFTIQVSQNTPIELLRKVPEFIEQIVSSHDQIKFDKINLTKIGDYSHDFEVIYYVLTSDFKLNVKRKHEILIKILEKFKEENIELPYPTRTVIVDN